MQAKYESGSGPLVWVRGEAGAGYLMAREAVEAVVVDEWRTEEDNWVDKWRRPAVTAAQARVVCRDAAADARLNMARRLTEVRARDDILQTNQTARTSLLRSRESRIGTQR